MRTFEELLQNASRVSIRIATSAGSHDSSVASQRSTTRATKPLYVAEIEGDQQGVTREKALQLISKGAADKAALTNAG